MKSKKKCEIKKNKLSIKINSQRKAVNKKSMKSQ